MFCFKGCSKEVTRLQEENARLKVDCDSQISHYIAESNIAKNKWREAELRYNSTLNALDAAKAKIDELAKKLKADYVVLPYQANDAVSGESLYNEPLMSKYPAKKRK